MTILNFKCEKCNKDFDFNAGRVKSILGEDKVNLQELPICPFCGETSQENIKITNLNMKKLKEIFKRDTRNTAIKTYKKGELMSYTAIFGGEKILSLSFKGIDYKIGDYYCVSPLCNCTETWLKFFHANSKLDHPLWGIVYDYSLDKITECENISKEDSREIIDKLRCQDKNIFSKRHIELKSELSHPLHHKFFKVIRSSKKNRQK